MPDDIVDPEEPSEEYYRKVMQMYLDKPADYEEQLQASMPYLVTPKRFRNKNDTAIQHSRLATTKPKSHRRRVGEAPREVPMVKDGMPRGRPKRSQPKRTCTIVRDYAEKDPKTDSESESGVNSTSAGAEVLSVENGDGERREPPNIPGVSKGEEVVTLELGDVFQQGLEHAEL